VIPSLDFSRPGAYALWALAAFFGSLIYGSFFEWTFHRFVMHRRIRWFSLPFELHAVQHHGLFGADHTYHAQDEDMKKHVLFVARDYIFLLAVNFPVALGVELFFGRPMVLGWFLATLGYLQTFNMIHWRFHVPSETWFQRSRLFLWLKRHHLLHHENPKRNTNVVIPLADLCLGTLAMKPLNAERVLKL
jgi:hypothetical protein